MRQFDDATRAQVTAADPTVSTWLGANAGSGKTRVLTDRVARLLLNGVPPQRILCLTYTKAAAGEMQNRLFKRLGAWAMLDDDALSESLADLGISDIVDRDRARTLFARAIDTPGGLKIQTIHSFCSAMLRQFPLEAGVSPQFRELDEVGQTQLIETVLDEMASETPDALENLARYYSGESFVELCSGIATAQDAFLAKNNDAFELFDVSRDLTLQDIHDLALGAGDLDFLRSLPPLLATSEKTSDIQLGESLNALETASVTQRLDILAAALLFGVKAANPLGAKVGKIPTKAFRTGLFAEQLDRFEAVMRQVETAHSLRLRRDAAVKTDALRAFAAHFLPKYSKAKSERGFLDFDDLIRRAKTLLEDVDMTWILYRLDGGIDHILVDEAQDTSPAQWGVIQALSAEMTSGQGARAHVERTLFVVGDKKQSIYSFQGADARGFDLMRETFSAALEHGVGLKSASLTHSFRSAPPILKLVDHVFEGDVAAGLGDSLEHAAFHENMPGRVDLWDTEEPSERDEPPPWYDPVDRTSEYSPRVRLANRVATKINWLLKKGTIQGESGAFRRIRGGDILILVRGRGALFDAIIRACKNKDLPMAGTDRLRVNAELAVRDILALLSFAALPDDALSLATALRSPLLGWSEEELYDLAHNRGEGTRLWQSLRDRREEFPETFEKLAEIRRRADFLRPFELIETILTGMGGRRNLVERLGLEAEDGINELLNQALTYEQAEVPSLTGFLMRAQAENVNVKRQVDSQSDLVRVMTVHGAKGLEAPIVFLPDTIHNPRRDRSSFVMSKDAGPLWNLSDDVAPTIVRDAKDIAKTAAKEEENRLLYVAMTRAASWLIVAGAKGDTTPKETWWDAIHEGMMRAGAQRVPDGEEHILRLSSGDWSEVPTVKDPPPVTNSRPERLEATVEQPTLARKIISPSALGGEKVIVSNDVLEDQTEARQRGTDIHRLLEVLPTIPEDAWHSVAERLLDLPHSSIKPLVEEAKRTMQSAPDVFAQDTLSEVELAAPVPNSDALIFGAADRVVVSDTAIRIVDFKSNAAVPDQPEDTPEGLLRQMGAYLLAAEQIWPQHEIIVEILWTKIAHRMVLPHAIVRNAFARTPIS